MIKHIIILAAIIGLIMLATGCQTHSSTVYYPPTAEFHTVRDGNIYGAVKSEKRIHGMNKFSDHKTFQLSAFN